MILDRTNILWLKIWQNLRKEYWKDIFNHNDLPTSQELDKYLLEKHRVLITYENSKSGPSAIKNIELQMSDEDAMLFIMRWSA
jgi:hypothetical protein